MSKRRSDRELGMDCSITRRDFLNGVALTLGATILHADALGTHPPLFAPEQNPAYYPPDLMGLRGNHEGSFEVMHEIRDDSYWNKAGKISETGEEYDLVIVGGGISGLAAAYFFRKHAGSSARILILDNHDDFGGHAKRNEFQLDGRTILGFGGTWSIDSPAPYSAVAKGLIQELGIDVKRWATAFDRKLYSSMGLKPGVFFDHDTFGTDRLLPFYSEEDSGEAELDEDSWKQFLAAAPLNENAKRDLHRVYTDSVDYFPGMSSDEKKAALARMSYADFLSKVIKVDAQVIQFLQSKPHGLYGVGIDAVPAQDAWGLGFPGFDGMNLDPSFGKGMNLDSKEYPDGGDAYFFHFPDGNATITRLLVRSLVPGVLSGKSMDDILTARCNYAGLDKTTNRVRIRLNSTAVKVQNAGKSVDVTYSRGGQLMNVRGKRCVLACWSTVIPYIFPELPQKQKEDLAYEAKVPLLYTNVLLSNWNAFVKAGVRSVYCPASYHSSVSLDMPVSLGGYHCTTKPEEPILVHLMRTPCSPGQPARTQHREGRMELFGASFEDFERKIREQLASMFGPFGLDPARDIRAITVNRWAHGYAYQYNSLFDPFWLEGKETPCERARKPFGHVSIANADTGAYAYTDCAIDQAYRAVQEIL